MSASTAPIDLMAIDPETGLSDLDLIRILVNLTDAHLRLANVQPPVHQLAPLTSEISSKHVGGPDTGRMAKSRPENKRKAALRKSATTA